jgi:hypothetical protein
MRFLMIVWRNLLRRKFRTFFTMGAIFFRVPALRRADGHPIGVQHGRGMAGQGPADGD